MTDDLVWIERKSARALVAPGFSAAVHELDVLDAESWGARFAAATAAHAGGRGSLCEATLADGSRLVLRGFRPGGWLAGLRPGSLASPTRLFDELRATHELARRGAPVPRPAFAVAHRRAAGWQGGVATQRIDSATNAQAVLRSRPDPDRLAAIACAAGRAVRRFHDAGGRHADLHLGNLVVREGDVPRVLVVDLDRARVGSRPGPARRARELARLARSLDKSLRGEAAAVAPEALRAAFLTAYVEDDSVLARELAEALRRHRWRLALHRTRYDFSTRARS
jgi:3-deoxy-D-manno-octulosonic acid kinase